MADRMQIYIESRQDRLLKQRAKQLGMTEAEVVRQSLDQTLAASPLARRHDADA